MERLEKRGLVDRMPAPEDGRGVLLRLTDAGRELQKEIGREHVRDISALVAPALTPDGAEGTAPADGQAPQLTGPAAAH